MKESKGFIKNIRGSKNAINKNLDLGKLPPQALDLEESVLGALMLEKDALTDVIDILKPENFYKDANKEIYKSIIDLFNESEPVDLLTVTSQLKKNGKLEYVGGSYYVTQLTTRVNSASNIEYHARIILEQSIKRQLIEVSGEVQKDAYEDTTDVFDLLDNTEQSLFDISESHIRKNYSQVKGLMKEAIDELQAKKTRKDGITGVPSGFIDLDNITSGWQPSDLVIIAGRPSMGKTAFVLSMMRNASIDHEMPIALFSLEMSSLQIVNRLISSEAELDSDKIKKGNLKDYEWQQLLHKTDQLNNAKIFIDDTPALTILELRAKSRRLKSQHNIQCIIVDYLQLMSGEYGKSSGNREQEIASISRSLKAIAKELNVPVLALSQLSRAVETRGGDKRPVLSDLRESGSIEQDADMVLFIYRADRYDITEDEDGNLTAGVAEVLLRKNRNGPTGKVKLKFIERYAKFADLSSNDGMTTKKYQSKANNNFDSQKNDPF
ncbi:MAG: replicative DNA helicase [Cytophagales bacterium]|nr:replicative DNA helicase [Marinoscillum sp.]OUX26909.1 MAG: replicative DNA helicase [Flammeovirgaceae bacterium TMED262]